MPKNEDKIIDEPKADAPADAPQRKPLGQNPGDVVHQSEATGGRYEAVGAGMMRRLPD